MHHSWHTSNRKRIEDARHTHQLHRYGTHRQTRDRTRAHTYAQVVIISERVDRGTARHLEKAMQETLRINCLRLTSSLRSGKECWVTGDKSVRTRGSRSSPHEHKHAYIDIEHRLLLCFPVSLKTHMYIHTTTISSPEISDLVVDAAMRLQHRPQNVGAESRSTSCTIDHK